MKRVQKLGSGGKGSREWGSRVKGLRVVRVRGKGVRGLLVGDKGGRGQGSRWWGLTPTTPRALTTPDPDHSETLFTS